MKKVEKLQFSKTSKVKNLMIHKFGQLYFDNKIEINCSSFYSNYAVHYLYLC